jgi:hypothetical protein
LIANKFFPSLLDRRLAKNGYDSQQTNEAEEPNRADNLWEPIADKHGTHGDFDSRARSWCPLLWSTEHLSFLAALLLRLAAVAFSVALKRRTNRHSPSAAGLTQPKLHRVAKQRYASQIQKTANGRGRRIGSKTRETFQVEFERCFQGDGKIDVGEAAGRFRENEAEKAAIEEKVK